MLQLRHLPHDDERGGRGAGGADVRRAVRVCVGRRAALGAQFCVGSRTGTQVCICAPFLPSYFLSAVAQRRFFCVRFQSGHGA